MFFPMWFIAVYFGVLALALWLKSLLLNIMLIIVGVAGITLANTFLSGYETVMWCVVVLMMATMGFAMIQILFKVQRW